jgi:hypothetical protein
MVRPPTVLQNPNYQLYLFLTDGCVKEATIAEELLIFA